MLAATPDCPLPFASVRSADTWAGNPSGSRAFPIDDQLIRYGLYEALGKDEPIEGLDIYEELGLNYGACRADLALMHPTFCYAIEIKSDLDSLSRLENQASVYAQAFDFVTLVVGWRLAETALRMAPNWWEIWLAEFDETRQLVLVPLTAIETNPSSKRPALARLISRTTALIEVTRRRPTSNLQRRKRREIQDALSDAASLPELRHLAHADLRRRTGQAAEGLHGYGG